MAENKNWRPPEEVGRLQCTADSDEIVNRPDIPFVEYEDLFRIDVVGMDWDIGAQIYEPSDPSQIAVGADGKKIGVYLLSGGDGDFKTMAMVIDTPKLVLNNKLVDIPSPSSGKR